MGKQTPEQPERLGLRPIEVAKALGVSERTVRQILPGIPHLRIGTAIVVPIESLKKWLIDEAKVEEGHIDAAVEEILEGLEFDE